MPARAPARADPAAARAAQGALPAIPAAAGPPRPPAAGEAAPGWAAGAAGAAWPAWHPEPRPIAALIAYARNARTHSDDQLAQIAASIREWGWTMPVLLDEDSVVIAGHGRILAAQRLGIAEVPCIVARGWTDAQKRAYRIADNQLALQSGWDQSLLRAELSDLLGADFNVGLIGFGADELEAILRDGAGGAADGAGKRIGSLAERFLIPPFSVLDARAGWWQERKRGWLALGLQSELGRGENLLRMSDTMLEPDPAKRAASNAGRLTFVAGDRDAADLDDTSRRIVEPASTGTSVFDPVLCEIAYRWFCPPNGLVLDPFAGGSVRGLVAAKLGRRYLGIDLRAEQCAANDAQRAILGAADPPPEWRCGDARELAALAGDAAADFVFSCPPYGDLERYSDDPRDLSTMPWADFLAAYRAIVGQACARLSADRFACFVVGEVRGPGGAYRGLVPETVRAFADAGLALYNEAILVTMVGSLSLRAAGQFTVSRKLGKTHQNVLVFVKGDARRATAAIGEVEFGEPDAEAADGPAPLA